MQIELTEKNKKWLVSAAKQWSATPTLIANQMLAKTIAYREVCDRRTNLRMKEAGNPMTDAQIKRLAGL